MEENEEHSVLSENCGSEKEFLNCTVCGRTFDTESDWVRHMGRVHNKRVHRFRCRLCNSKFQRKVMLKNHYLSFHLNMKRWKCEESSASLGTKRALSLHKEKIHIRRFRCELCSFKTQVRIYLEDHYFSFHLNIMKRRKCGDVFLPTPLKICFKCIQTVEM
jgi:hypothetical protein